MKAKDFELLCIEQMTYEQQVGSGTMSRYGVQASIIDDQWRPIKSLPDFEGVLANGQQFIFDAKVCSGASFPLAKFRERKSNSRRQFLHMLDRSAFKVTCFFLIHFKARKLTTKQDPQFTVAVPVSVGHPIWEQFEKGELNSITRTMAREYGTSVDWVKVPGGIKDRPDIIGAIYGTRERIAQQLVMGVPA